MSIAYASYRLFGLAIRPLVPVLLDRRARRGKEDAARVGERRGEPSRTRPSGRVAWVHAASVGETNAVMPLIERLVAAGLSVVLTTVTVTSARIAEGKLPAGAIHQFVPVDVAPWIARFLAHWRPEFALFVESELWPATIIELAAANVPLILVNARLSERSFASWRRFGRVARDLFSRIALCLAQSSGDGDRYRLLGLRNVVVTGNLKFDLAPPPAEPAALASLQAMLGERPVWLGASTHAGEEVAMGRAHLLLRDRFPGLLTIVVPRHPARGADVAAGLSTLGLAVARRSVGEPIAPNTDLYLADTMNELGLFYRVAPFAFVGGSLAERGGQNPIEPVQLGCAVLHGPFVFNFAEIYEMLDGSGAAMPVPDAAVLTVAAGDWLAAPEAVAKRTVGAESLLAESAGALKRTLAALEPYVDGGVTAPTRALPAAAG